MIIFTGYGVIIVMLTYFGGIALLGNFVPKIWSDLKHQYYALVAFHIVITAVNYGLMRYLNRKGPDHTLFGIRMETVCWVFGLVFLPLLILMGKDLIY